MSKTINYKLIDNKLYINNNVINLPYPVHKVIEISNSIAVLLEIPMKKLLNRNVYLFSSEGEQIWQIEEPIVLDKEYSSPYTNIWLSEQGDLLAYSWSGFEYIVDLENGSAKKSTFKK